MARRKAPVIETRDVTRADVLAVRWALLWPMHQRDLIIPDTSDLPPGQALDVLLDWVAVVEQTHPGPWTRIAREAIEERHINYQGENT